MVPQGATSPSMTLGRGRARMDCRPRCLSNLQARPTMKKASEYRQHAAECRRMVLQMKSAEHRDQLLQMARTWELLAQDRETADTRAKVRERDGASV